MKKYSFIAIVVLAAFMAAACSRSKLSPEADENAWMYDETLPVPIQLGANDIPDLVTTKALPVVSTDQLKFKVLMMDINEGYVTPKVGSRILLNEWAQGDGTNLRFLASRNGTVVKHYYPMVPDTVSRFNYSFFAAHYPNTDDVMSQVSETVTAPGTAYVTFPLKTGTADHFNVDILHAKAHVVTPIVDLNGEKHLGYNASYLRQAGATTPNLQFQHVSSQIIIKVQAASAEAAATFYVDNDHNGNYSAGDDVALEIGNFKIISRYTSAKLDLLTGELTPNSQVVDTTAYTFYANEYVMPTSTPQAYPYSTPDVGIFIIPGERQNCTLQPNRTPVYATVGGKVNKHKTIVNDEVVDITSPAVRFTVRKPLETGANRTFELTSELRAPDGGFLPGKKYVYTLTINSIQEVVATLSVASWDDGTLNDGDSIIPIG